MLHKNVTEEYKTDQFLHVIYWFLIYKSNLGHFFRNEGIFFSPLLLLFSHQLLRAQTSPAGQVPAGAAPSRMWPHACPRVAHALAQLQVHLCAGKPQSLGGKGEVVFAPPGWPPPSEAANLGRRADTWTWGVASRRSGPSGLLPKWPIFSGTQTSFMTDRSKKRTR